MNIIITFDFDFPKLVEMFYYPNISFCNPCNNSDIGKTGAKVENTYLANFEAEIVKVKVLQAEFGWIFFANTKNSSALYHLGPIFIN